MYILQSDSQVRSLLLVLMQGKETVHNLVIMNYKLQSLERRPST